MTEQLLAQQLESPSGTGRVEPRSDHQPDSPRQQATGCQPADPILTGSYERRGFASKASASHTKAIAGASTNGMPNAIKFPGGQSAMTMAETRLISATGRVSRLVR